MQDDVSGWVTRGEDENFIFMRGWIYWLQVHSGLILWVDVCKKTCVSVNFDYFCRVEAVRCIRKIRPTVDAIKIFRLICCFFDCVNWRLALHWHACGNKKVLLWLSYELSLLSEKRMRNQTDLLFEKRVLFGCFFRLALFLQGWVSAKMSLFNGFLMSVPRKSYYLCSPQCNNTL